MKKMFTFLFATLMTLLSSTANAVEVTVFEPDQFYTSVDELLEAGSFAIVNKTDGKALFGSNAQNLGYDVYANAFKATNSGYQWKLVDADENGNYFLQLITPTGANYNCWGMGGYLNSQGEPQGWACSFILGLNGQNGQDIANGAVYTLTYTSNGWTIYNVGTSMYQPYSTGPANSTEATYWEFCSLKENTYDDGSDPEPVPDPLDKMVQMAKDGTLFSLSTGDQYLYGTGQQGLAMGTKEEAEASENFYSWKLEQDSEYPSEFRFIATKTDGTNFVAWGANPSYLNTQPALTGVTFVLGKDQDITKGSEWYIESAQGGYTIKNRANNGYLAGTGVSEEPVIWQFNVAGEEEEPEEPEGPAQAEIADGEYFFYNSEAEAFLSNGAYWGTRAVLVEDNGIAYNVKRNAENGKYTLYSGIKGATKALRPSDGFNDQSGEWEILEADEDGNVYLFNGTKYFSYIPGSKIPNFVDEADDNCKWTLGTREMILESASMANRDDDCIVNATLLLKGADFLNSDDANAAWEGSPKVGGNSSSNNTLINNTNCEKWNAGTFNVSQTVTDMPNGFYNLKVFGFYREGNRDQVGASDAFEAGTENASILKANNKEVALKSVYSEAKTAAEGGWSAESSSTAGTVYYIPNSQGDAAACFEAGAYVNELKEIEVTDGTLTISISREGDAIFDWTVFDNFRLEYLGTEPAEEEVVETDLTKEMFFAWTAADGTAEQSGEATYPDYNIGTSTGMVYGYSTVNYLSFADLSEYDKMVITVTEGTPRALFNRTVNEGPLSVELPRDAADYWTEVDNGDGSKTFTIDIAKIVAKDGFAHLHAIKGANWANTTVTSIKLIKKGSSTTPTPAATLSDITLTLPEGADFEEDGDLKVVLDYKAALENCNGLLISGNAYYTVKDAEGQVVKTSSVDFDTDATSRNIFISDLKYNKDYVVTIDKMEVINTDLTTFESTTLTTVEENLPSLSIKLVKPMATISGIELAEIPADQTLSASDKDFTVVFNYAIATEGCEGGIPAGCVEYTVKDANGNTVLDSSTDLDIDKTTRNIYLKGLNFDETYTMTVNKVSVNFLDITTFETSIIEEVTEGLPTVTFTVAAPVKISNQEVIVENVDLEAHTADVVYSYEAEINPEYPDATGKAVYTIFDEEGNEIGNGTADLNLKESPLTINLTDIPESGLFIVRINEIQVYQNADATEAMYTIESSATGYCGIYDGYVASTATRLSTGMTKSYEQQEVIAMTEGAITFSNLIIPVSWIATGQFTIPVETTEEDGMKIYRAKEVEVMLNTVYQSGGQDDPVPYKAWLIGTDTEEGPVLFLHLQNHLQDFFIAFNARLKDAKWMIADITANDIDAGNAKILNVLQATSINTIETDANAEGKILENGKVVIMKNDKKYNVNGAIIK